MLTNSMPCSYAQREHFKTFLFWAILVGVSFFGVYPATNWLASMREAHFSLYFLEELKIPFVASFIWIYLSMYLLFLAPPFFLQPIALCKLGRGLILATLLSGVAFILFPAKLGFDRVLPTDSLHSAIYERIFSLDKPFNLAPSLHVVYSSMIIFSIMRAQKKTRFFWIFWLILIASSTVLVHQHHLFDIASGLLLAIAVHTYMEKK